MLKLKKKYHVKKPIKHNVVKVEDLSDTEANDNGEQDYDSMIENGTSDSDNSTDENISQNAENKTKIVKEITKKHKLSDSGQLKQNDTKRSKRAIDYYRPPTALELNQLKETENLFHSNLFRMQIEELLKEVHNTQKTDKIYIENWLGKLNSFLDTIKSGKEKHELDNLSWLKEVKLPLNRKGLSVNKGNFQFKKSKKPAFIFGSQLLKTILGPILNVDVCIELPKEFFQTADYLNQIYHQKRALYLCWILKQLLKKAPDLAGQRNFTFCNDNPLKPVLVLSNPDDNKNVTFTIHTSIEENTYKLSRFIPARNNVRSAIFMNNQKFAMETEDSEMLPTPHYNATILSDLVLMKNCEFLKKSFQTKSNIQDGIILLKVWLRQRELDNGYSGFSGFIITMFVAYLLQTRKVNPNMSSYQIVRNVWNHLALGSWDQPGQGITLCSNPSDGNCPTLEMFHEHFDVVFLDISGYLNICANLSVDVYKRIKHESKMALALLDNSLINSFQCLFMTKITQLMQYDHIVKIHLTKMMKLTLEKKRKMGDKQNYCNFWYPSLLNFVTKILRKGLDGRIISLTPIRSTHQIWSSNETPTNINSNTMLILGFILNPSRAFDIVDKGPQANEPEALEFRNFWGEKAQLRRFKDGSITEACVWESSTAIMTKKRLICRHIVMHLLSDHLQINEDSIKKSVYYIANQLNTEFKYISPSIKTKYENGYDTELMSLNVIQQFDEIGKTLRFMEGLPLEITSVQGISPIFRYCDPDVNFPNAYIKKIGNRKMIFTNKIYEGVIHLGSSGKWPDNLEAIKRLKTAFYLEICKKLLQSGEQNTRATVNGIEIMKNGFIFRFKLAHTKELHLLRQTKIDGVIRHRDTSDSLRMEKNLFIMPSVTSALHGLHQQYNAFGPTVCLARRWLNYQLFDNFLWPDECTELLVASLYVNQGAQLPPCQPQLGFLRFLHLIGYTNWENEMVIINFNNSLTQDDITDFEVKFTSSRDKFPPLNIVTSYDGGKFGIWTKNTPIIQVLVRVALLARELLIIAEKTLTSESSLSNLIYEYSFEGFDAVIEINHENIKFIDDDVIKEEFSKRLPAEFNPVIYFVQELRDAFDDFAAFFYNPMNLNRIGVLWKPQAMTKKDFKISEVNGRILKNGKLFCTPEMLIRDFEIIGNGLVEQITIKNE